MHTATLFETLFNLLNVKFTNKQLSEELTITPYINSMYGIGLILAKYNIDHRCIRLIQKEQVSDIPLGIIIFKGAFVVLNHTEDNRFTIYSNDKHHVISLQELLDGWDGVIMTISAHKGSGESSYQEHKKDEFNSRIKTLGSIILISVVTLICTFHNHNDYSVASIFIAVINAIGIGISYLLLQKQLHIPNKFADKICGIAKESHCEDVTQSDGANLFGLFKLSEIGATFFSVNLLILLFFPWFTSELALFAVAVLPFSFWSIWYQKTKVKSWCVLCLTTLVLMWVQAAAYILGKCFSWSSSMILPSILILSVYGIVVLAINRIMLLIEDSRKATMWKREFNFIKSQDYIMKAYIHNATQFETSIDNCSGLIFGDKDAAQTITIFSNPYCGPCAAMHKQIENYPGGNVRIQYVLTYFSDDRSDINRYIIAAYQQLGAERTWQLLSEWYNNGKKQGETFFKPFNLDITTEAVTAEFEKHKHWRRNDNLYGTPTVIINGCSIEYPYDVSDYVLFSNDSQT